ncbi:MAG: sugar-binding protein [Verrucomicrobiota bacterium]|nr:sugar-binding protein [Verrucomicrobiota bacterium]
MYPLKNLITGLLLAALVPVSSHAVRVFMVGNSVTDSVNYGQFQQLAQSRGYTHIWGRQVILGSPLWNIWNNPEAGFLTEPFLGYPNAFANYDWDAITLQTYDSGLQQDINTFSQFLELARQRPYTATNGEFFTFARWPRQDKGDYSTYWVKPSDGSTPMSENADYFEKLTTQLKAKYPGVSIRMIPVGYVFYELEQRMKAGLIPGYTGVYADLYSDGVHQTDDGRYICALTFFATIYKDDPRGLPLVGFNLKNPAAAATFQEVVWEVVTRTPLSGVQSSEGLTITTTRIPRGSVNRSYATTMRALFGTEPYSWTVTAGTLPAGITFSGAGLLSGTPTTAGNYPVTIKVTDATNATATLDANFEIVVNTIPAIATASTPGGFQGTPYDMTFTATLGDPPLVWTVSAGSLPLGMKLTTNGRLYGTPGVTGNFTFTVKVDDDDFPADTNSKQFTLVIGQPEANTVSVPRILQPVTIDGDLSESFWTINKTVTTVALGNTPNTVKYGTAWDINYLYIGVQVTDNTDHTGRIPLFDNDSVEFLLDANHDRETVYNVDDRRLIVDRAGELLEFFARGNGVIRGVKNTASGYTVEIAVPWDNLGRTPYPGMGVGFDLINSDNQDGSGRAGVLSWDGSNPAEPAPNTFGNLLLSGTVAGQPAGDVLICYEPFSGPETKLHSTGVPLGWKTTWGVQNANATGYAIAATSLPSFGNHRTFGELLTQGLRATGGQDYLGCGRILDNTGAFASYVTSGTIGKTGTTLYASWIARLDSGGSPARVALCAGGIDWVGSDYRVSVYTKSNKWYLGVYDSTLATTDKLIETDTGIAATAGEAFFFVVSIEYNTTSTVKLYINPQTLGGSAPAQATLSVNTTSALGFTRVNWYPGSGKGAATLDEIRIGTSYAAVTPIKPYPPIIDTHPAAASKRQGQPLSLSVASFSRTEQTYQWFRNSSPINGATASTYEVNSIGMNDFGTYTVRIANSAGYTTSNAAIISENPYPTDAYSAWATGLSWANTNASLPNADADGDGFTNLYEYAFGSNPLVVNASNPNLASTSSDTSVAIFAFSPVRIDAALSIAVQGSSDLLNWSALPVSTTVVRTAVSGQPGFETWTVTVPKAELATLPLYARLRVAQP